LAGISYNKFLAKLASDQKKPNGQFAVMPEMGPAWVETLPVECFHGVGPVTAAKMKRLGIETGADLRAQPLAFLEQYFGSSAGWYHAIARGKDHRPVNPNRTCKSTGPETTFDRDLTHPPEIEAGVLRMADDVWGWCERAQAFGRTVTVKVKFQDFRQITRSRSHAGVVADRALLYRASLDLVRSIYPPETGIRLVGVTVSNFEGEHAREAPPPLPLFGSGSEPAQALG
jgi:DNA polymerase-4